MIKIKITEKDELVSLDKMIQDYADKNAIEISIDACLVFLDKTMITADALQSTAHSSGQLLEIYEIPCGG